MSEEQLGMTMHPTGAQIAASIRQAIEDNCLLASAGTDNYRLWSMMKDGGLLKSWLCPQAMGVTQFKLTRKGLALAGPTQRENRDAF